MSGWFRLLIPYRRLRYRTAFRPEEVREALQRRTAARPAGPGWFFGAGDAGDWRGTVTERGFELQRVIGYRNSFRPALSGVIAGIDEGAELDVRMRMRPAVLVFAAIWMLIATVGGAAAAFVLVAGGQLVGLAALAAPVFGTAVVSGAFAIEARRAEELLYAHVPRREEQPEGRSA